jgi:hypothetical protein
LVLKEEKNPFSEIPIFSSSTKRRRKLIQTSFFFYQIGNSITINLKEEERTSRGKTGRFSSSNKSCCWSPKQSQQQLLLKVSIYRINQAKAKVDEVAISRLESIAGKNQRVLLS